MKTKITLLMVCIVAYLHTIAQQSISTAPVYSPSPNGEAMLFPTTVLVNGKATLRNVSGLDIVKGRVDIQRFLDSIDNINIRIASGGGGGTGADLTNYYTKTQSDGRYPSLSGSYADPVWLTSLSKAKVGLNNVPNTDATNPANIVWNATYSAVSSAEKTTWNNKQNALGYTPVANTTTVAGKPLSSNVSLGPSDVGLGAVPNIDATNPANIVWNATYRNVSDAEKTTWNAKQNALGYTPVPNTLTINGFALNQNIILGKSDVGLPNADNTSDANKPISTAVAAALAGKQDAGDYITATEFTSELAGKVDAVAGMGLSSNDFSSSEKTKLAGIQPGATVNQSDAYLLNRANHTGYLPQGALDPSTLEALDLTAMQDDQKATMSALGSTIKQQTLSVNLMTINASTLTLTDGRLNVCPIYIAEQDTLTGLKIYVQTAGVFNADNNNKIALYKFNGTTTLTKIGESLNDTTMFDNVGMVSKAFTAPVVVQPGLYYAAVVYNAAGTATTTPAISAGSALSGNQQTMDISASMRLFSHLSTQTDMPATITTTALTNNGNRVWFGTY